MMVHPYIPLWASLLMLTVLVGGCGDDQDPEGAQELFDRIQAEDYRGWERAPGYATTQPSDTAHSDAVDIYVNDVVAEALAAGEPLGAWPLDSLIVKDGFDGDGDLDLIAAMEKREGGWFWVEYTDPSAGGEAKYSGEPGICIDCHDSGSDFVRAFPLP
jgi:hypothetical protein